MARRRVHGLTFAATALAAVALLIPQPALGSGSHAPVAAAVEDPPTLLLTWGGPGSDEGEFLFPISVATGPEGNVYVVDQENDRVQKFTAGGQFLLEWGSLPGEGRLSRPLSVAVDSDGNVYVADEGTRLIHKYTSDGEFLFAFNDGEFPEPQPSGVAVGPDGNVYVVYSRDGDCCVRKFNPQGELLTQWGTFGSAEGQFDSPRGVTTDALGNVYVADHDNGRIQKFTAHGGFLAAWDAGRTPRDLAIDDNGDAYVADLNFSAGIRKFDSDGNPLFFFGFGIIDAAASVALGAEGNIYVVDRGNHRIQVFEPGTPENSAPEAVDDVVTTDEDTPVIFDVLGNDTDADGDSLVVIANTDPADGSVTDNGGGAFTYTPNPDFNGDDSFNYTIEDGNGGSDTATVEIAIIAVNDDPAAADDEAVTDEDVAVTIDVLANDSDVDGDPLSINGVTQGANGSVGINADGTVTYAPNPDFNGNDSFTYGVDDGNGGSDGATVNVTVNPVNDAPVAVDDMASTSVGTPVTIDVLANDTDVDGDPLSVSGVTQGAHGSVEIDADGTVTWSPVSIDDIIADVQALPGLNSGQLNSLTRKLEAAKRSLARGNVNAARGQLRAFINEVEALGRTGKIAAAAAADLIARARGLMNPASSDSFDYTISDGNGGSDTATVTVTIS